MPLVSSRKGFYVSTPLVGSTLFLIAFLLSVTMSQENDQRIGNARAFAYQDRLQFISQAMEADSYDVLLQNKLEKMTSDFLKDDYFNLDAAQDNWGGTFRSGVQAYYMKNVGETLGVDLEAYRTAYENMPGIDKCSIEKMGQSYMHDLSVEDSDQRDGTVMARGHSYGEVIICKSTDPEGEAKVDIFGRYYYVKVRLPLLYEMARWSVETAKAVINGGSGGIAEPVAKMEAAKWTIIKKADNLPVDPAALRVEDLAANWKGIMEWLAARMKDAVNNEARSRGYSGFTMAEFEALQAKEGEYKLDDFEVSCADDIAGKGQQSYRNCMPFRVEVVLGDKECTGAGLEPPRSPDGKNPNPIYELQANSLIMKCGDGPCPQGVISVMSDIVKPVGSACVNYYGLVDSVFPVCKAWKAKPRALVVKGVIEDTNRDYVIASEDKTVFKFKDDVPTVNSDSVKGMRLTCDSSNSDRPKEKAESDVVLYKTNVRTLLAEMDVKLGAGKDVNSAIVRWIDKGSALKSINDESLKDVYSSIYAPGVLPVPCLTGTMKPSDACMSPQYANRPKVMIDVDWAEARTGCVNRANDLCSALCGGAAAGDSIDLFCRSMFPEAGTHLGAKGKLVCTGGSGCGDKLVEITSMAFATAGPQ